MSFDIIIHVRSHVVMVVAVRVLLFVVSLSIILLKFSAADNTVSAFVPHAHKHRHQGVVLIPGIGNLDRLATVTANLRHLNTTKGFFTHWKCVVYVYSIELVPYVSALKAFKCIIHHVPGQHVSANIKQFTPTDVAAAGYKYVFILLDDVSLINDKKYSGNSVASGSKSLPINYLFDLQKFLRIMERNHLTLASPHVLGAMRPGKSGTGKYRAALSEPYVQQNTVGCLAPFLELFVYIMTAEAYSALWDLVLPEINPYGWGYDVWYDGYASERVAGHRMGVIYEYSVTHGNAESLSSKRRSKALAAQRVDLVSQQVKMAAMLAEEDYFRSELKIELTSFVELEKRYPKLTWWENLWSKPTRGCSQYLY